MSGNWIDEQGVPKWGTGPDGGMVRIDGDTVAAKDHAAWAARACVHAQAVIAGKHTAGGTLQYRKYCSECGLPMSSALPHASVKDVSDKDGEWFAGFNDQYVDRRKSELEAIAISAAARLQSDNRRAYGEYLSSPEWRRRRDKVLKRANGICEGCLTLPATEVHHTTYEHLGQEFAFELIALCDRCHSRLHGYATEAAA